MKDFQWFKRCFSYLVVFLFVGFLNVSCTNQCIGDFAVDSVANNSLCIASVRLVLENLSNTSCQEK